MKHLMITALLAFVTFAASAQFDNQSSCDLRVRTVCIDENTCSIVPGSQGAWTTITSMNTGTVPAVTSCTPSPPYSPGYEVDYAPSTGCSGNPIFFNTDGATNCVPPYKPIGSTSTWPPGASEVFPPCSCGNPVNIMFHYDPNLSILTFTAIN